MSRHRKAVKCSHSPRAPVPAPHHAQRSREEQAEHQGPEASSQRQFCVTGQGRRSNTHSSQYLTHSNYQRSITICVHWLTHETRSSKGRCVYLQRCGGEQTHPTATPEPAPPSLTRRIPKCRTPAHPKHTHTDTSFSKKITHPVEEYSFYCYGLDALRSELDDRDRHVPTFVLSSSHGWKIT